MALFVSSFAGLALAAALAAAEPTTAPAPMTAGSLPAAYWAREPVWATFRDTRLVNVESVETLRAGYLDFRIEHRFGDAGGPLGDAHTLYGLDLAENIRLALAYGVSDAVSAGVGRSRGAATKSPVHELYDGFVKLRLLRQTAGGGVPVSAALFVSSGLAAQPSAPGADAVAHFPRFDDRLTYTVEPVVARKVTSRVSLELAPVYVRRNRPGPERQQDFLAAAAGLQVALTDLWVLLAEYAQPLTRDRKTPGAAYPFAGALQIPYRGHVFTLTASNAAGIEANEWLPYRAGTDWARGQFRLGFNLSRQFGVR